MSRPMRAYGHVQLPETGWRLSDFIHASEPIRFSGGRSYQSVSVETCLHTSNMGKYLWLS